MGIKDEQYIMGQRKHEHIALISALLAESEDIGLLDLIYKILHKSRQRGAKTMKRETVTAQEVRDTFLAEDIEQELADTAQIIGKMLDYKTSECILANCCTSIPEEQRQSLSRYDRLCWIARSAFLAGYLQATKTLLETAEADYTALFAGAEQ